MFEKFGRISPAVKPAVLRHIYRALTGDSSASNNMQEVEIDECVLQIVSMEPEDPNTIVDLREVKHSETRSKFEVFWGEAQKFINKDLGVAVDDRRHNEVQLRLYQFVIYMSRLHSVSPQMYLYLVRSGLGYNSGLKHLRKRYLCTTQGNSMFVSWFKRGSFDTTTKMSIIVQQSFDTCVSML